MIIKIVGVTEERSKEIIQKFKFNKKAYEWLKYIVQLPIVVELQEHHIKTYYIVPSDIFVQSITYRNDSWITLNTYGMQDIGDGKSAYYQYLYTKNTLLPLDERG